MNYSFPFASSASTKLCGLINCTNSARKSYTSLAITFYIAYKMSFTRVGTFYLSISSLRLKGSCSASVNAKNRECEDSSSTEHVQRTDFMNPGGFSADWPVLRVAWGSLVANFSLCGAAAGTAYFLSSY